MHRRWHGNSYVRGEIMELSKPYKGKRKRKIKKMPFTVKGYILYYAFFLGGNNFYLFSTLLSFKLRKIFKKF